MLKYECVFNHIFILPVHRGSQTHVRGRSCTLLRLKAQGQGPLLSRFNQLAVYKVTGTNDGALICFFHPTASIIDS